MRFLIVKDNLLPLQPPSSFPLLSGTNNLGRPTFFHIDLAVGWRSIHPPMYSMIGLR